MSVLQRLRERFIGPRPSVAAPAPRDSQASLDLEQRAHSELDRLMRVLDDNAQEAARIMDAEKSRPPIRDSQLDPEDQ